MTDYQITKASMNRQTDILNVEGYALDTGKFLTAQGWVSATTNYYPPDDYDDSGNLSPDSQPRQMTDDELRTYIVQLLRSVDVRPVVADDPAPVEEDITGLFS